MDAGYLVPPGVPASLERIARRNTATTVDAIAGTARPIHGELMNPSQKPVEFSVFDTETTGFNPREGARLLEIGVVRIDQEGNELARFSTLVNPGDHVDLGPTEIHAIERHHLTGAPSFAEIAGDFISVVQGSLLVAHNAPFDTKFLSNEFTLAELAWPSMPVLDTLGAARFLLPGLVNHKLATVAAALEVIFDGPAHSALADALVTSQVHAKLLKMTNNLRWPDPDAIVWPDAAPSGLARTRTSAHR